MSAPVFIGSPHFMDGRKHYKPEAVVIHIAQGSRSAVDSWFNNPASQVSAHYLVCTDGAVHQYVHERDTAWHAGRVHNATWAGVKRGPTGVPINPNYYTVGVEHEGKTGVPFTDAMMLRSAELLHDIATRWSIPLDRAHVVGHHEIYALKPFCPGDGVDLDKLILLAKGGT